MKSAEEDIYTQQSEAMIEGRYSERYRKDTGRVFSTEYMLPSSQRRKTTHTDNLFKKYS